MRNKHEVIRLVNSFKVAIKGIINTFVQEKNMQIHGWIALGVTILSVWAGLPWWHYIIILAMILLVWAFELINTAIESVCNLASKEPNPLIKKGKDAAAGAVLLISILAVVTGYTLLIQPLLDQVDYFHDQLTTVFVPNAIQLAILICVWLLLFGVIIKWNYMFRSSLLLSLIIFSSLFALFIWSATPWFQLLILLLPFFVMILTRRGLATLFAIFQIFVSNFGVYLVYYLLK